MKRTFKTKIGDVIEVTTRRVTDGGTNVVVNIVVRQVDPAGIEMRPSEFTRFADRWMHDVDAAVWGEEMADCELHDLTGTRCVRCGRYCGTPKRCPHCVPPPPPAPGPPEAPRPPRNRRFS